MCTCKSQKRVLGPGDNRQDVDAEPLTFILIIEHQCCLLLSHCSSLVTRIFKWITSTLPFNTQILLLGPFSEEKTMVPQGWRLQGQLWLTLLAFKAGFLFLFFFFSSSFLRLLSGFCLFNLMTFTHCLSFLQHPSSSSCSLLCCVIKIISVFLGVLLATCEGKAGSWGFCLLGRVFI